MDALGDNEGFPLEGAVDDSATHNFSEFQELSDELELMDDAVFNSHVNEHKNDFSSWVNDTMNLKKLAENMKSINNKEDMIVEIKNWHSSL